jgi:hypothetical protein
MLQFERDVVATLLTKPDAALSARVTDFVDGTLRDMPQLIRAGVAVESVVLSAAVRLWPGASTGRAIEVLDRSPVMPLRQYGRLFRSLVLFAENEL